LRLLFRFRFWGLFSPFGALLNLRLRFLLPAGRLIHRIKAVFSPTAAAAHLRGAHPVLPDILYPSAVWAVQSFPYRGISPRNRNRDEKYYDRCAAFPDDGIIRNREPCCAILLNEYPRQ